MQWPTHRRLTSLIAAVIMSVIVVGGVATPLRAQVTENWTYRLSLYDQNGTLTQLIPAKTFELNTVPKEVDTLTISTLFSFFDVVTVGQKFPSGLLELIDGNTGTTLKAYQLSQVKIAAMRLSGSPTNVDVTIATSVKTVVELPPQ